MSVGTPFFRRALTTCAGLLAVVALMLGTCVIPAATRDPLSSGAPDQVVAALWTLTWLAAGVAAALVAVALTARSRSFLTTGILGLASIATLLLALLLNDAGMAYWGHGAAMRGASLASFTGAGTCLIVATTVLSTAFLLPGRSSAGMTGEP
jgi:hypothetical protein